MNTKNLSESSESEIGPQSEFGVEIQLAIIQRQIILIRREKVMLDSDLAELYGVSTKRLNEQVRRNIGRFPADFMFQLSDLEARILRSQSVTLNKTLKNKATNLRSQIATSSLEYGGRRYLPLAFTEQGIAMLSSVLHSRRAIQVNIAIMRAFVRLRKLLAANVNLAEKIIDLEQEYDQKLEKVFKILEVMKNGETEELDDGRPPMGFTPPKPS